MADKFQLKALITAVDRLSPVLQKQMKVLSAWRRGFSAMGRGGMVMGAGLAAAVLGPAKAFAEAESAATQLKNTLMNRDGLALGFDQLSKIAVELGNRLPGTTADFMSMASQLKALGVSTDTMMGGALQATAYLAVVGKPLGVTYESAAEAIGKLSNAFGIAAADLTPFADTLQRTLHMGVDLEQMQYAMARVAGPLKGLGKQGLGVANDLVPLVAMLISAGVSGEEAGTGIKKMISVAAAHGKFKDIATLVKDIEKLNGLDPAKKMAAFKNMFGEEHAGKALIIAAGGYSEMLKKMELQASLQQRINNSLSTLANLWEAATGTFTNAMVAIGEAYAPELKALADSVNNVSSKLLDWAKVNGPMIKTALEMAGAFVGLKVASLGVAMAIGVMTAAMKANPLMIMAQAVALFAPLIINNWDTIIDRLTAGWRRFVEFIQPGIDTLKYLLQPLVSLFGGMSTPSFDLHMGNKNSMRPPGYSAQKMFSATTVSGGIDVNFNNAPAGLRVAPAEVRGPLSVNPNVGYRSLGFE